MPSKVGPLMLAILGTMPAVVMMVLSVHNPIGSFKGSSLLMVVAVSCACVSILVAQLLLQSPATGEVETQTEYLESGNGTMGNSSDPPPVYDAVVAKPPPYQDLYIICSDTSSSSVASGTEGGPREAADRPSSRLATAEETQRDPDLPSYSEVAKTAPLAEGESEFVSRENVSSSSE